MATAKRVYIIRNSETGDKRLVRAVNASRARNHVARDTLTVKVASQDQLIALLAGEERVTVEDAGGEPVEAAA